MKAICIGRNYLEHIQELSNTRPEEPVVFMKTEDNIHTGSEFSIPGFTSELHYECELVYKIGSDVSRDFHGDWRDIISQVTLGIDLTARDMQDRLKARSLPWELAKNFRQSAVLGEFIDVEKAAGEKGEMAFDFYVNGALAQHGDTRLMIFGINDIIRYVLTYVDLNAGDLIFTGTPKGVGQVNPLDEYKGELGSYEVLKTKAV